MRTVGGAGGYSTLSGSGSIGQFYFFQGNLVALDSTQSSTVRGNIGAIPVSSGCSTYGQLGFSASSSDNCAVFDTFNIQSNAEDSQLGAQLVFNFAGGFYACGSGQDVSVDVQFVVCRVFADDLFQVWYQADATDGPPGLQCSPINLYTVPV